MTRSPALIFDFGNVVAHFDYGRAAERFARTMGVSASEFARKVQDSGFLEVLKAYESGGMTSEAFHLRICEMTGLDCDFERFAEDWRHIFWANEPVHRLIDGLRGLGYSIVLGSNTNPLHAAHFRVQFAEVFRHFDRLVLSYEVGHIKPSPEFYLACAERRRATAGRMCVHRRPGRERPGARRGWTPRGPLCRRTGPSRGPRRARGGNPGVFQKLNGASSGFAGQDRGVDERRWALLGPPPAAFLRPPFGHSPFDFAHP